MRQWSPISTLFGNQKILDIRKSSSQEWLSTDVGVGEAVTSPMFSKFTASDPEEEVLTWKSALFSAEDWTRAVQMSFQTEMISHLPPE